MIILLLLWLDNITNINQISILPIWWYGYSCNNLILQISMFSLWWYSYCYDLIILQISMFPKWWYRYCYDLMILQISMFPLWSQISPLSHDKYSCSPCRLCGKQCWRDLGCTFRVRQVELVSHHGNEWFHVTSGNEWHCTPTPASSGQAGSQCPSLPETVKQIQHTAHTINAKEQIALVKEGRKCFI